MPKSIDPKSNEELAMEFCIIMRTPVKAAYRLKLNDRLAEIKRILIKRIGLEPTIQLIKDAGKILNMMDF